MKTKRVIISLRDDELDLLKTLLKDYHNQPAPTEQTPIQAQGHKILKDNVQKLINKLEAKNGKDN